MSFLTREQILEADDLKTETVPVPEWGGEVIVRTMTGGEYSRFEKYIIKSGDEQDEQTDLTNIRAKLCSLTIVDEAGEKIFSEEDIIELAKKSAAALNRVSRVAQKLNVIGADDGDNK